jgi:hypothetical protein
LDRKGKERIELFGRKRAKRRGEEWRKDIKETLEQYNLQVIQEK